MNGFQITTFKRMFYRLLTSIMCIFCGQSIAETRLENKGETGMVPSPELEYLQTTTQNASKSASRYQHALDSLRKELADYQYRIAQATRESELVSQEVGVARRLLKHLQQATENNRLKLSVIRQQAKAIETHQLGSIKKSEELQRDTVGVRLPIGEQQRAVRLSLVPEVPVVNSSTAAKPVPRTIKKKQQQNQSTDDEQNGIVQKATAGGVKIVKDEAVGSSKRVVKKVVRDAFNKALGL